MKQDSDHYEFHFLICTNEKPLGECCAKKGAQKLVEELKPWLKIELKAQNKFGKGRVNKSGCLGRCGEGIACVAYPSGEWLTDVKVDEVDKIKDFIREELKKIPPHEN
ncbi:MAG: (2Fe-2S) ferredoxin domain-containing protein [Bdellovibrionales bacterium]|nr:(2Fe-2S) ferredoxin domain-containing protein [Bdellovibrionales bacterium]